MSSEYARVDYRGWEVYLFSEDFNGIRIYFAVAPEMIEVCSSVRSFDDVFALIREQIDDFEKIAEEYDGQTCELGDVDDLHF